LLKFVLYEKTWYDLSFANTPVDYRILFHFRLEAGIMKRQNQFGGKRGIGNRQMAGSLQPGPDGGQIYGPYSM
jgi:hypothetical protein